MRRSDRSEFHRAVGKLISAIQKEWNEETEQPAYDLAEEVMNRAGNLISACWPGTAAEWPALSRFLDGRSVAEYLDPVWVEMHPSVHPFIEATEAAIGRMKENGNTPQE